MHYIVVSLRAEIKYAGLLTLQVYYKTLKNGSTESKKNSPYFRSMIYLGTLANNRQLI